MQIHVVQPGQTLWSIGREYGVLPGLLARFNGLTEPYRLAVGQAILILRPESLYTVQPGDTVFRIAQKFSLTQNGLYRLNPGLSSQERLYPGQVLVTSIEDRPTEKTTLLGYAYPWANERTLRGILPYADTLVPFTYGFTEAGELVEPDDEGLLALAKEFGAKTLLHLSTLTEQGSFSAQRAGAVLGDDAARGALIQNTVRVMREKGFAGVDVDFEYLGRALAASYAAFLRELADAVHAAGGYLMAALAPKTSDDQPGVLYEGHNYAAIGQAADKILLMTYEWGFTYGPPMAVAPLNAVERVVQYAVSRIEAGKLLLGFPNYAYDWTLPYEAGLTRAATLGNEAAAQLAFDTGSEIFFDEPAQTPWFSYTGMDGAVHEVWFEDVRSSFAKFGLVRQYGLGGLGYWNFMRPFAANFSLLNAQFRLEGQRIDKFQKTGILLDDYK